MMALARDRLIVALDVPGAEQARALIDALQDSVGVYKIGLELLFAGGMALASELASRGMRVFIAALGSKGTKVRYSLVSQVCRDIPCFPLLSPGISHMPGTN